MFTWWEYSWSEGLETRLAMVRSHYAMAQVDQSKPNIAARAEGVSTGEPSPMKLPGAEEALAVSRAIDVVAFAASMPVLAILRTEPIQPSAMGSRCCAGAVTRGVG